MFVHTGPGRRAWGRSVEGLSQASLKPRSWALAESVVWFGVALIYGAFICQALSQVLRDGSSSQES